MKGMTLASRYGSAERAHRRYLARQEDSPYVDSLLASIVEKEDAIILEMIKAGQLSPGTPK